MEFVSAVSRPVRGHVILPRAGALREAEEFLSEFEVIYPNEAIVREAVRGCAAYRLNGFDAHIRAYAEYYGIPSIASEGFRHDRFYGPVRALNPFVESPWISDGLQRLFHGYANCRAGEDFRISRAAGAPPATGCSTNN